VAERQLNLFTTRSVLCERFDAAFFRSVPRKPGIYLMSDARHRIIYVGKAKDLRARLGSYRYAHERCSRKTSRLVARIANIRWQICASEEAALLEENRLLQELRPRFNRVNTWPKAYRFVRIAEVSGGIKVSLSGEGEGECYGAFKGASRQTFGALLRLLTRLDVPYSALPRPLLCERAPTEFEFNHECAARWLNALRAFLRGKCDRLLKKSCAVDVHDQSRFHITFHAADLATLEHFFRIGPQRNHALRGRLGSTTDLIAQEDLDDWIVRGGKNQRADGSAKAT
jgi:hypothetical protein